MTPPSERAYPDRPAGPFPRPPARVEDAEGRSIELRVDGGAFEELVAMYESFRPEDRAQGIPPFRPSAIRGWLEKLTGGVNLLAWHEGAVVGHATLVPDEDGAYELAIFVLHDYQSAGVGTALLKHLLGEASSRGVERVWLTVERWNRAAIALYENVGFERTESGRLELEMSLRI